MSLSYQPQSDGQTEWLNQSMETFLRCFVNAYPSKQVDWFYLEEFLYNSSSHSTIGHAPFVALYGYEPQHFGIHLSVVIATPDLDILAMRMCSYDSSN